MTRQIHDTIWWTDVTTAAFENIKANPNDPELAVGNGIVGLDRVIFWLRK